MVLGVLGVRGLAAGCMPLLHRSSARLPHRCHAATLPLLLPL